VRTAYVDGGQHPWFAALIRKGAYVGLLSRPEALSYAPREIVITPARAVRHVTEVAMQKPSGIELSVFGRELLGYQAAQLIYNRPLLPGSMEILPPVLMASSIAVAVQE
jgi:hypothetical protein